MVILRDPIISYSRTLLHCTATQIKRFDVKIEGSETAGSHRELNPGHLACAASTYKGL